MPSPMCYLWGPLYAYCYACLAFLGQRAGNTRCLTSWPFKPPPESSRRDPPLSTTADAIAPLLREFHRQPTDAAWAHQDSAESQEVALREPRSRHQLSGQEPRERTQGTGSREHKEAEKEKQAARQCQQGNGALSSAQVSER